MEGLHNGGEQQYPHLRLVSTGEQQGQSEQRNQPREESHDERLIREGIEAALQESRNIDDRTARYIASQLHEGQGSALYSLASSGAIDESRIHDELTRDFESQSDVVRNWINWLGVYCMDRADKGPVAGWAELSAELDRENRERLRQESEAERLLQVVETARQAGHEIDACTARGVARQLSKEFGCSIDSALGALATCGAILEDGVYEELYADIDAQSPKQQKLVDALRLMQNSV